MKKFRPNRKMVLKFLSLIHDSAPGNPNSPADIGEETPEKRFAFHYLLSRGQRNNIEYFERVPREHRADNKSWHNINRLTAEGYDLWFEFSYKITEESDRLTANVIAYIAVIVALSSLAISYFS